jgi:signal transduction histidine kinase
MVRDGVPGHIRNVPPLRPAALPGAPAPGGGNRVSGWLPRGLELAEPDWWWRHRVVCAVLGAHLPVILVLAATRSRGTASGLLEVALPAVLLALALLPLRRRLRALAASLGLLTCSALLVHLFAGHTEAHFHYFVVVALVALYQDWPIYALAIGFVALQHTAVGVLAPGTMPAGDLDEWAWGLLHAGFVLAESAVLVLFWHAGEQAHRREQRLLAAIDEGSDSLRARLAETDRMRRDLIGTVSHEFRTPLTGIRGATLTLLKRGEQLDAAARGRLLHAVLDQQERLSRLLENMLTAAQATDIDPAAVAEVDAVAAEVAMLAEAARGGSRVQVLVEPHTLARIDRHALHQVLANLVDNAQQHGSPGAVPIVAGGLDQAGVWLTVSNDGSQIPPEVTARLFEPFTQADSGVTRDHEGIGMGLYVVRRLVEVHGGRVAVRSDDGWVTVEVRLEAVAAAPATLPATSSA